MCSFRMLQVLASCLFVVAFAISVGTSLVEMLLFVCWPSIWLMGLVRRHRNDRNLVFFGIEFEIRREAALVTIGS